MQINFEQDLASKSVKNIAFAKMVSCINLENQTPFGHALHVFNPQPTFRPNFRYIGPTRLFRRTTDGRADRQPSRTTTKSCPFRKNKKVLKITF